MSERPAQRELPVDEALPRLCEALQHSNVVILAAPPGSGKTTRVPLALTHQDWLAGQRILMLEPRRIAARAAATYMAGLRGSAVGEEVGFSVRFQRRVSAHTRVHVVTEGVLTRRLQTDPELGGVGLVIFDEFHERNLDTDLGLALCLDVQQGLRPDLKILIMSATLDRASLARLLPEALFVEAAGAQHAVEIRHRSGDRNHSMQQRLMAALTGLLREQAGDVLVFLPGAREIRRLAADLDGSRDAAGASVCPLYAQLSPADQDRALQPDSQGRRRIVLATNIAESSLTLDGIRLVLDCGLARRPRFDPNSGLERLETVKISRASAAQRAGRAGRQHSGVCVRLWSAQEHLTRPAQDTPAIRDSDLCRIVLELAAWGITNAQQLRFPDPLPAPATAQAVTLLQRLGALDHEGRIVERGRAMVALPAQPRLAAMLASARGPLLGMACDLAAVLDAPELFTREAIRERGLGADLEHRLLALHDHGQVPGSSDLRRPAVYQARQTARQLRTGLGASPTGGHRDGIGELLLHAYPDRIAQRRPHSRSRYLLRGGRGASLIAGDSLGDQPFLVVADMDAGHAEGAIHRAAAVELAVLERDLGSHIEDHEEVVWDARQQRVQANRQRRLGALVLDSRELSDPDPVRVREALLVGIRQLGVDCLNWNRSTRQLQARIQCLGQWCPSDPWPAMDDQSLMGDLESWLGPSLAGIRQAAALRKLPLGPSISARVPPQLRSRVDSWAPTHLRVASGSLVPLDYRPGSPPVLAVKLQEMFGQTRTPTVCNGRIAIRLQLLSPAGRAVQITQDLGGFWRSGYPEVRRELRGRYPKHPWPEDPLHAPATRKTTRARR